MTVAPTPVLEWVPSLQAVSALEWDALVEPDFPFSRHAFLRALETSESVGVEAGWNPTYLLARQAGRLIGALFAYDKTHSYGEYIFDWAWAEAYQRAGLAYYPKRVAAVPMTPATGRRVLLHPDAPVATRERLVAELARDTAAQGLSSAHVLFCEADELPALEAAGFMPRHSFQFHWHNHAYPSFDAFLAAFKSRKRKQIHLERESVRAVPVSVFTGASLTREHADVFYPFYWSTCEKKGAFAYLRPAFFESVFENFKDDVVLFLAGTPGNWIAASLCFRAGNHLYGRYWGCAEEVPGLHFELCYYRPIDYAITEKLTLFEAGAQGEHKIARGFLPALTYSAHWIAHPGFRKGVSEFLESERLGLARGLQQFDHSPYRTDLI
jgi:predicted N-acyltransferase